MRLFPAWISSYTGGTALALELTAQWEHCHAATLDAAQRLSFSSSSGLFHGFDEHQ